MWINYACCFMHNIFIIYDIIYGVYPTLALYVNIRANHIHLEICTAWSLISKQMHAIQIKLRFAYFRQIILESRRPEHARESS